MRKAKSATRISSSNTQAGEKHTPYYFILTQEPQMIKVNYSVAITL